jgi:pilus assembly protein CpaC
MVNAVAVSQPLGDIQQEVSHVIGVSQFRVDRDGKGNLIVSGRVADQAVAENIINRVRAHAGAYLAADGKIIDRLAIDTTTQVDVKVYVLEVDKTASSQLGLQLQSGIPDPNNPGFYTLAPPSFPGLETPRLPGQALTLGSFYRTTVLAPTLNLILGTGHARVLSSPDLVTMPGQQATFLVGGQIPIPVASGPQQISIEYKDYGVQLKVTPTILPNGGVETVVAPDISDLDYQNAVEINGFNIPALKTSKLSTDVVTHSGESIVLGGLLRRLEQRNIQKFPLLGDIPILGQLFRSTTYQKQDSDLVFIMTPQVLVR